MRWIPVQHGWLRTPMAGMATVILVACGQEGDRPVAAPPTTSGRSVVMTADDFQAGPPDSLTPPQALAGYPASPNPFEGNRQAWADGKRIYSWFNCAECHGSNGGGGIGPPLRDDTWIYGDAPANIFQSIAQGRPKGMPTFGHVLPDEEIWKLVTFVQSLGGGEVGESQSQ